MSFMNDAASVGISAFGAVTPLGSCYQSIKYALENIQSGVKEIKKFDTHHFVTHHAGLPENFNRPIYFEGKRTRSIENTYAMQAAKNLLQHEQYRPDIYQKSRVGCIIGVDEPTIDLSLCLSMLKNKKVTGRKLELLELMVDSFRITDCLNLEPSTVLSSINNIIPFDGYANTHIGLCSASLQAIGMGYNMIRSEKLDAVIVGGISGKVNPINLARLELMDVITTDLNLAPDERSRPFDNRRSGFYV